MKEKSNKKERVLKEFEFATECIHTCSAFKCGVCIELAGGNPLNAPTKHNENVGQVIDRFTAEGKIKRVFLEQYVGLGKKGKRRNIVKIAGLTGLTVVGIYLFYEGGKWLLKILNEKENGKNKR